MHLSYLGVSPAFEHDFFYSVRRKKILRRDSLAAAVDVGALERVEH